MNFEEFVHFGAYDIDGKALSFERNIEIEEDEQFVHIRLKVKNTSELPVHPALFKIMEWDSKMNSLHVFKPGFHKPSDNALFYTPEVGKELPKCNTYITDCLAGFPKTSLLFSTMSAFMLSKEEWILWGFSTFEAYHGVIEYDVSGPNVVARAWLEGDRAQFDPEVWVELEELTIIKGEFVHCVDLYCKHLTNLHGKRAVKPVAGWSDWEYYRIPGKTEEKVLESTKKFGELKEQGWPLDSIVLDAGWCKDIYIYNTLNDKFPHGAEWLCEKFRENNAIPGIWIAPWITTTADPIAKEHPEWLVIDRKTNKPRAVHREDGQTLYTIDFSFPEAVEWFRSQLRMMLKWGYKYFKLDGPVFRHYDNTRFSDVYSTRYKQINVIMRLLREECGEDVLIESEGVYGPAIGIADFHRVTQDEHPRWYNGDGTPILAENTPTTLCSSVFNGRLWANLNLLVLRDCPTPFYEFYPKYPDYRENLLTETELQTNMTSVWFSCSALYNSAPLSMTMRSPYFAEAFRRVLPTAKDLNTYPLDVEKDLPMVFKSTCNGRSFLHVYNHGEAYADHITVPLDGKYHVYDYWNEKYLGVLCERIEVKDLAPRGCRLYWLTPVDAEVTLVGANAHIAGMGIYLEKGAKGSFLVQAPSFSETEQKVTLAIPEGVKLISTEPERVLCDNRQSGMVTVSFVAQKDKPVVLRQE